MVENLTVGWLLHSLGGLSIENHVKVGRIDLHTQSDSTSDVFAAAADSN